LHHTTHGFFDPVVAFIHYLPPMSFPFSSETPLAAISEFPSIGESLAFQLNGLVVVFIALGSIWALLELMGLFFRRAPAHRANASIPICDVKNANPTSEETAPELIAVIAAAVATVIKQPHRINRIAAGSPSRDWASEGRREIFGSHRIR
jgi:Na+-transporting methylmalonyl-CoA/oxaloacetate decarboxylase gamma subunit